MAYSVVDPSAPTGGGSGDMILASTQTNTGAKTFNTATLLMRDPANTFSAEPYSDANPPFTLNLSDQASAPANPPTGQSTLYSTDGTNLNLRDNAGTTITLAATGHTHTATNVTDFSTAADARVAAAAATGTGSLVRATSPTLVTPALGTPASGVATNLTGTAAGLTAGTVTTNANLTGHVTSTGNATVLGSFTLAQLSTAVSDANVARTDAAQTFTGIQTMTSPAITTPTGIVKGDVGLGNVDNTSDATKNSATATLTNKRVTVRTGTTTSSATPTINTDNVDFYSLTAQAADITSFTTNLTGTPTDGQKLWIAITGTEARAITWGASFEASTVALPVTTVTTARLDVGFVWNAVTSKWRVVAVA